MIYTNKIQKAINFAIKIHSIDQKQNRKGKDIPYIVHPLTVGIILSQARASEDVITAGILHDTIEDSTPELKITKEIIEKEFGIEVAELVDCVTEEDKDLSWEERKSEAINHIKDFNNDSVLLKSADLLSNIKEILQDYEEVGEKAFDCFKVSKEKTIENYSNVIDSLSNKWKGNPLSEELLDTIKAIKLKSNANECAQELVYNLNKNVGKSAKSLKKPIQCILWEKPELIKEGHKEILDEILVYCKDDHFSKRLLKCKECGQLYFREYYEEIDWVNGDDPQYVTFLPVENETEIDSLKKASRFELFDYYPRLQDDYPKTADKPKIWWNGK